MTRIVFSGGSIFDGTGAMPAAGDVAIEDGRIVDVGPGLDGDQRVDATGKTLLPGLFDCHVHLAMRYEDFDETRVMNEPFSLSFFRMAETLRTTLALGITTARDAMGADAGLKMAVEQGVLPRTADADQRLDAVDDRRPQRPVAPERRGRHLGHGIPGHAERRVRRRGRRNPQGPRDDPGRGGRDQDRVVGRLPLARRRSAGAELLAGGGRRDRPDGRRPRDVGDVRTPTARRASSARSGRASARSTTGRTWTRKARR